MTNANGKDSAEDTGEFEAFEQDQIKTAPVDWLDRELANLVLELTQLKALTEDAQRRVRGASNSDRAAVLAGIVVSGTACAAFIYNRMNAFNDALDPRPL